MPLRDVNDLLLNVILLLYVFSVLNSDIFFRKFTKQFFNYAFASSYVFTFIRVNESLYVIIYNYLETLIATSP